MAQSQPKMASSRDGDNCYGREEFQQCKMGSNSCSCAGVPALSTGHGFCLGGCNKTGSERTSPNFYSSSSPSMSSISYPSNVAVLSVQCEQASEQRDTAAANLSEDYYRNKKVTSSDCDSSATKACNSDGELFGVANVQGSESQNMIASDNRKSDIDDSNDVICDIRASGYRKSVDEDPSDEDRGPPLPPRPPPRPRGALGAPVVDADLMNFLISTNYLQSL